MLPSRYTTPSMRTKRGRLRASTTATSPHDEHKQASALLSNAADKHVALTDAMGHARPEWKRNPTMARSLSAR
jgi:hypothetical protein